MSEASSVYEFSVPTSTGEEQSLKAYEGKVMLIVNTRVNNQHNLTLIGF